MDFKIRSKDSRRAGQYVFLALLVSLPVLFTRYEFNSSTAATNFVSIQFSTGINESLVVIKNFRKDKEKSCVPEAGVCVGALMMVNAGALSLYQNFVSFLNKNNIHREFLICTSDIAVSTLAMEYKHKVIMIEGGIPESQLAYNSKEYQLAIFKRTEVIGVLLQSELYDYIIVADVDSVWLCDPYTLIFDSNFRDKPFQVGGQMDGEDVCGGFLVLQSASTVITFWRTVTDRYHTAIDSSAIDWDRNTEQHILNDILREGSAALNVSRFDKQVFPSGVDYFEHGVRQKACVVHNNFIIGIQSKIDRFKKTNLWLDGV